MNSSSEYSISFAGLNQGIHSYSFQIGLPFFEGIQNSEIQNAEIGLEFVLHKQSSMLTLEFTFNGWVEIMCDRCADFFTLPITEALRTLYVKFSGSSQEESDEIVVLTETEHEINISHYIYEFIHLALPLRRVHPEGRCNTDILNQLDNFASHKKVIDPRWKVLDGLNKEQI